jgi:hypothetical protein
MRDHRRRGRLLRYRRWSRGRGFWRLRRDGGSFRRRWRWRRRLDRGWRRSCYCNCGCIRRWDICCWRWRWRRRRYGVDRRCRHWRRRRRLDDLCWKVFVSIDSIEVQDCALSLT